MLKTELILVCDRSGSMDDGDVLENTVAAANKFLEDQKTVPGECRVSVLMFDDRQDWPITAVPLALMPGFHAQQANKRYSRLLPEVHVPSGKIVWQPRGSTALLDAIGDALELMGKRIAHEKWAEKVIVVVLTDGLENMSRRYTRARITDMIRHAEANGWSFIFLGANIDAFGEAGSIGISGATTRSAKLGSSLQAYTAFAGASKLGKDLRSGMTAAVSNARGVDSQTMAVFGAEATRLAEGMTAEAVKADMAAKAKAKTVAAKR